MGVINRYLTREISKLLGVVLIMVVGVYLAVDFFEKIDDFIEAGLPWTKAVVFFTNKIPFIIAQITPVGILLSVLVVFGLMSKRNELIALKSNGVSVYALAKPVMAVGLATSLLLFYLSESIVPPTMEKANRIWLKEVRNEKMVLSKESNIWLKGEGSIIHISHYEPGKKAIFGLSLNVFDSDFRLIRRVDAKSGVYTADKWYLFQVLEQRLGPGREISDTRFYPEKEIDLGFKPEALRQVVKNSEEMSYRELTAYIRRIEAEGYDATRYRVDRHGKIALPFVCVIMCLVGAGIGMRGNMREGLPVSVTYGIGIAFLYWIFYSFCMSLGYGEMLPPVLAAWTANFIFFCLGLGLLLNAE